MKKSLAMLVAALVAALAAVGAPAQQAPEIPKFSTSKAAGPPPADWKNLALSSFKKKTDYSLVTEEGVVVVRAMAHGSASILSVTTDFDPRQFPMLSWRWKVVQGIPEANNADQNKEDSPARVMVGFSGDSSKLNLKDRIAASTAQSASGHPFPYALLMYIWGGKVPIGSTTTSSRTSRIKMIALSADDQGIGKWQSFTRNIVEDYKKAFGEDPGNVTSIELLTDTDNTGGDAEAFYGDITIGPPRP
jgi:Protein of unknown function (DUF3047)